MNPAWLPLRCQMAVCERGEPPEAVPPLSDREGRRGAADKPPSGGGAVSRPAGGAGARSASKALTWIVESRERTLVPSRRIWILCVSPGSRGPQLGQTR